MLVTISRCSSPGSVERVHDNRNDALPLVLFIALAVLPLIIVRISRDALGRPAPVNPAISKTSVLHANGIHMSNDFSCRMPDHTCVKPWWKDEFCLHIRPVSVFVHNFVTRVSIFVHHLKINKASQSQSGRIRKMQQNQILVFWRSPALAPQTLNQHALLKSGS